MSSQSMQRPPRRTIRPTTEVVTPGQIVAGSLLLTLCSTLFLFPAASIAAAGRSAWLLVLVGMLFSFISGFLVLDFVRRVAGETLADVIINVGGPRLGRFFAVLFFLVLLVSAVVDYRLAVSPIEYTFFERTPLWVVVALLGVTGIFWAWTGPVRMARLYPLLAILITATFLVITLIGAKTWDLGYLLPVVPLDAMSARTRDAWAAVLLFRGPFALAIVAPHLRPRVSGYQSYALGLSGGTILLLVAAVSPVAAFNSIGAQHLVRPFMTAVGTLAIPSAPVTRVEFFARLFLQANSVVTVSLLHYGAMSLLSHVLRIRETAVTLLGVAIPPIAAAGFLLSDPRALMVVKSIVIIGTPFMFAFFLVLWVLACLRPRYANTRV